MLAQLGITEACRLEMEGVAMQFAVIVEEGPNSFGAYVPDLPGCIAAGDSKEEVLDLIKEAIALHLEGMRENGEPPPRILTTVAMVKMAVD